MMEKEFWERLGFRVCREMDGLEDCRRLGLWCDGFIPEQYVLGCPQSCVTGRVWMGFGSRTQEAWRFILVLHSSPAVVEDVRWSELAPPDDVTQWLAVDVAEKRLEINPGAGVPMARRRRLRS